MKKIKTSTAIAIAALLTLTGCGSTTEEEPQTTTQEETAQSGIAETVNAGIENNFPGGIDSGSPLYAVTEYEEVNATTVRVYVQNELTENERDTVATHVFNMSDTTKDELSTVVVRDTSGKDSNHYR